MAYKAVGVVLDEQLVVSKISIAQNGKSIGTVQWADFDTELANIKPEGIHNKYKTIFVDADDIAIRLNTYDVYRKSKSNILITKAYYDDMVDVKPVGYSAIVTFIGTDGCIKVLGGIVEGKMLAPLSTLVSKVNYLHRDGSIRPWSNKAKPISMVMPFTQAYSRFSELQTY